MTTTARTSFRLISVALAAITVAACSGGRSGNLFSATGTNFYAPGPHEVVEIHLDENEQGNPKEARIFVPATKGRYPLLVFQHGFTATIEGATDFLTLLARHGFVVVAGQMYRGDPSTAPTIPEERDDAVAFLTWLQNNINGVLQMELTAPLAVTADTSKTGLFGHSRGGQVAWRMLFDIPGPLLASAVAGVDPVDGDAPPFPPGGTGELVTDDPGAFNFPFPSLIIGMGRGNQGAPGFECAPENRNYTLFYDASAAPRYEVVASDYGHSDMLNGDNPEAVCPGDTDGTRDLVRAFVSGQLAAYFTLALKGFDERSFLRNLNNAPIATTNRFED